MKNNSHVNYLLTLLIYLFQLYGHIYSSKYEFLESNDLYKMYDLVKSYDFIFASRYLKNGGSEDDTIITLIGNKIFSLIFIKVP